MAKRTNVMSKAERANDNARRAERIQEERERYASFREVAWTDSDAYPVTSEVRSCKRRVIELAENLQRRTAENFERLQNDQTPFYTTVSADDYNAAYAAYRATRQLGQAVFNNLRLYAEGVTDDMVLRKIKAWKRVNVVLASSGDWRIELDGKLSEAVYDDSSWAWLEAETVVEQLLFPSAE